MTIRSRRGIMTFKRPFHLKSIDRELPAGDYEVVTDEELIEGLSFASYRRIATMMLVPAAAPHIRSTELVVVDPNELIDAHHNDNEVAS